MANSSGMHHHLDVNDPRSAFSGAKPSSGNFGQGTSGSALKHNPGISTDWTVEEQAILDEGLVKYASESAVMRYAKIALTLQNKNVRDVALRCRWMTKKENSKRRKDDNFLRKSKDKKERYIDTSAKASHFMAQSSNPSYASGSRPREEGVRLDAIGGSAGEILKQNEQAFSQITANFSKLKLKDNISLLRKTRGNLMKLMDELNNAPELMRGMPPLSAKINEELANTILPPPSPPKK